jgi:predicted amidohydrolase
MAAVRLTSVQPPHPNPQLDTGQMLERAMMLLEDAGKQETDLALLPELLTVYGLEPKEAMARARENLEQYMPRVIGLAVKYQMDIVFPVLEERDGCLYNAALVIDRTGRRIGSYDKTHVFDYEADWYHVTPGDLYPVFDLGYGKIGILTCYDNYIPEVASIYSVKGVDILCYPRWESGPSEITWEMKTRTRALDHSIFVMTSSYGAQNGTPWKPGMLFGRSCIIGRDGAILADAAHHEGLATALVDLSTPRLMDVLDDAFGKGDIRDLRKQNLSDRRPETYTALCRPTGLERSYHPEAAVYDSDPIGTREGLLISLVDHLNDALLWAAQESGAEAAKRIWVSMGEKVLDKTFAHGGVPALQAFAKGHAALGGKVEFNDEEQQAKVSVRHCALGARLLREGKAGDYRIQGVPLYCNHCITWWGEAAPRAGLDMRFIPRPESDGPCELILIK